MPISVYIGTLICTLEHIPAIGLRLAPFQTIVTKEQKRLLCFIYVIILGMTYFWGLYIRSIDMMTVVFYKRSLMMIGLILSLANIFVIRGYTREHLFVCGMEAMLSMILPAMAGSLSIHIPIDHAQWGFEVNACITITLYLLLYPIFKKILMETTVPFLLDESKKYWRTVWPIPFAMFFSNLFSFPADGYASTIREMLGQWFLVGATVLICMYIAKEPIRLKERAIVLQQLKIQKQYYDSLTARVNEAREIRHNLKHLRLGMEGYIAAGDSEGLMAYCRNFMNQHNDVTQIPYTGNPAVDGILFHYTALAAEHDISCELSGTFRADVMDDMDLCVLLGNALDNAVEGCLRVSDDRFIYLATSVEDQVFSLLIRNRFDGVVEKQNSGILSRKQEGRIGVGLNTMREICERYGGSMETKWDQDTFTVMILLPTKE